MTERHHGPQSPVFEAQEELSYRKPHTDKTILYAKNHVCR